MKNIKKKLKKIEDYILTSTIINKIMGYIRNIIKTFINNKNSKEDQVIIIKLIN